MTVDTVSQSTPRRAPVARLRSKLDWSVAVSIALMLAMAAMVAFGDLGPATAYAAAPM